MPAVLFDTGIWLGTKDGDPRAFALYKRHYSYTRYADLRRDDPAYRNRYLMLGPGEKMVLVTPEYDALFGWRKFIDDSGQTGVNCAVFRNESQQRSSDMIREAEVFAWRKWPGARLYTYINAAQTARRRSKRNPPGYCFLCAGWRECGQTKGGLLILEKCP